MNDFTRESVYALQFPPLVDLGYCVQTPVATSAG